MTDANLKKCYIISKSEMFSVIWAYMTKHTSLKQTEIIHRQQRKHRLL